MTDKPVLTREQITDWLTQWDSEAKADLLADDNHSELRAMAHMALASLAAQPADRNAVLEDADYLEQHAQSRLHAKESA
jgi:hypothetical protein